jgi:hypothetical protein
MSFFAFKGLGGVLLLCFLVVCAVFFTLLLPSMVLTALWNALVFETLKGPTIGLAQGLLLWAMALASLALWLRPNVQLRMGHHGLEDDLDDDDDEPQAPEPPPKSQGVKYSAHWQAWRQRQQATLPPTAPAEPTAVAVGTKKPNGGSEPNPEDKPPSKGPDA